MNKRHVLRLILACVASLVAAQSVCAQPDARALPQPAAPAPAAGAPVTVNLKDFGAVGNNVADDGPALQRALDALVRAGGGTLFVPAGRYAIATPVVVSFQGLDASLEIRGVPSTTPVPRPDAGGYALTRGLDLTSEFAPKTGTDNAALAFWHLRRFLIQDIGFIGDAAVATDALVTLAVADVDEAVIRHCEFYGLLTQYNGGSIVQAMRTHLTMQQVEFLGCSANSGLYMPIIQNWEWKGIFLEDVIFADYGQRAELYAKTGYGAPFSWLSVGHAAPKTADSPRREVVMRRVFMDEGGWQGVNVQPARYQNPPIPLDLFYATDLYVNVSNFWQTAHYLTGLRAVMVENALYTWATRADSAIHIVDAEDAIIDRVRTEASATRLRAEYLTSRLTVIDSVYEDLASAAAQTIVINTTAPDEDPVLYVRNQFQSVLGREPDAAAHYAWSRALLDCGADAACRDSRRGALASYLARNPAPNFALTGRVTDENGQPLAGAAVALTGHLAASTTTGADGLYRFDRLPTSGIYTVTASKRLYSFTSPSQTITLPAGAQVVDFAARLDRYSIGGRLLDERGRALAGVSVALAGGQAGAATTDAQGNYGFANLPAGRNYTVTPQSTRYNFSPASQTFAELVGDKAADFAGTSLFYAVGGQVMDAANNPVAGLSVALSGGKTAAASTDARGGFQFVDLPRGGNYTVTPAKVIGSVIAPASKTFDNLAADQTALFVATPTSYRIAGRVTSAGTGLQGVTVTLTGSRLATATTDSAGAYSFTVPANGDYTVAPSRTHYTFDRASSTFQGVTSDQTADFTATLNRHKIAGRVARADGTALAGVSVALAGGQAGAATTDAQGNYSFTNLPAGANYTVTPTRAGYDFTPASRAFTDLGADRVGDFVVAPGNYALAGRVTSAGAAVSGVTMTLSGSRGATATTDASGNYSFTVSSEGSYTITPSKTHYKFAPPSSSFNNPTSAQTANFEATLNRHAIGGRVVGANNAGMSGVTVALSGTQSGTTTTDAQGNFSFPNLPAGGNYTVTPSLQYHTFAPASQAFNNLSADGSTTFNATRQTFKIAGRVARADGTALAGVSVALAGGQAATTTTTDAQGNFSFLNLPAGSNYTVTPTRANYSFSPPSVAVNPLAADFNTTITAALLNYTIAGRVTSAGAGLAGATVTLSGSRAGTTTTDAQGNYSFSVPAEGNYTVTPAAKHYALAPAGATFTNLDGNRTADFAATLNRHTITGQIVGAGNAPLAGVTVIVSGTQTMTAATDAQGNFSFPNLPAGGNYTVTPSLPFHGFTPAAQTFTDLGANAQASFSGARLSYKISGRVTEKGAGLAGVTVEISGSHPLYGQQSRQVSTGADGAYSFAVTAGGDYAVAASKKNYAFDRAAHTFIAVSSDQTADFAATLQTVLGFGAASYSAAEGGAVVNVTVTREGDTSTAVTAVYEARGDTARLGSDFVASVGLLTFAPGETSKTFPLFITDDSFVEGAERFTLSLTAGGGAVLAPGGAATASVTIGDNDTDPASANPLDDDEFFVRQHYRDFFSREPDAEGLAFWTGEIKKCGADAACREARRVSVSAAFFLSIEFQQTGYLVHRLYRATHGRAPTRVGEFMLDTRTVGDGVVVGAAGWAERLEANKKAFLEDWTRRPAFRERYEQLDDATFIRTLFTNMGVTPDDARREALLTDLRAGATRAEVLAEVVDTEQFVRGEFDRAFVLMQYFGYLRRNPQEAPDSDLTGYDFWLTKLKEFGGNYEKAEMVKAFLSSVEYRRRFGN